MLAQNLNEANTFEKYRYYECSGIGFLEFRERLEYVDSPVLQIAFKELSTSSVGSLVIDFSAIDRLPTQCLSDLVECLGDRRSHANVVVVCREETVLAEMLDFLNISKWLHLVTKPAEAQLELDHEFLERDVQLDGFKVKENQFIAQETKPSLNVA